MNGISMPPIRELVLLSAPLQLHSSTWETGLGGSAQRLYMKTTASECMSSPQSSGGTWRLRDMSSCSPIHLRRNLLGLPGVANTLLTTYVTLRLTLALLVSLGIHGFRKKCSMVMGILTGDIRSLLLSRF